MDTLPLLHLLKRLGESTHELAIEKDHWEGSVIASSLGSNECKKGVTIFCKVGVGVNDEGRLGLEQFLDEIAELATGSSVHSKTGCLNCRRVHSIYRRT